MLDPDDVGPTELVVSLLRDRLNLGLWRGRFGRDVLIRLVGQEGEGDAKDVDVLGVEHPGLFVDFVFPATQAASYHLLA